MPESTTALERVPQAALTKKPNTILAEAIRRVEAQKTAEADLTNNSPTAQRLEQIAENPNEHLLNEHIASQMIKNAPAIIATAKKSMVVANGASIDRSVLLDSIVQECLSKYMENYSVLLSPSNVGALKVARDLFEEVFMDAFERFRNQCPVSAHPYFPDAGTTFASLWDSFLKIALPRSVDKKRSIREVLFYFSDLIRRTWRYRNDSVEPPNTVINNTHRHRMILKQVTNPRINTKGFLDPKDPEAIDNFVYEIIACLSQPQSEVVTEEGQTIGPEKIAEVRKFCESYAESTADDVPSVNVTKRQLYRLEALLKTLVHQNALKDVYETDVEESLFGNRGRGADFLSELKELPRFFRGNNEKTRKEKLQSVIDVKIPQAVSDFYKSIKNAIAILKIGNLLLEKGATPQQREQGELYREMAKIYLERAREVAVILEVRLELERLNIPELGETLASQDAMLGSLTTSETFFAEVEEQRQLWEKVNKEIAETVKL